MMSLNVDSGEGVSGPHSQSIANGVPWTIARLLRWITDHLASRGVDDARLAGEVLLARAVGCRRIDLYTHFDDVPDERSLALLRDWVKRAAAGEPIAYLVEEKEFFSLPFRVTRDVLIPRPETELLVECILDDCAARGLAAPKILDLGTGSGCIAVALLTQMPAATAVATDVCTAALQVARDNAGRHGLSGRFVPVQADRLRLPAEVVPDGGFDVLVSNPPYVPAGEVERLDPSVRDYEPRLAVCDGRDGLSFFRAIAADAPKFLKPHGALFVEVGDGQMASVVKTLGTAPTFSVRRILKDRVGGKERVAIFDRTGEG